PAVLAAMRSPVQSPARCGSSEQGIDLGPQIPPGDLLGLGQFAQGVRGADGGEVGILLPVKQCLPHLLGAARLPTGKVVSLGAEAIVEPGEGAVAQFRPVRAGDPVDVVPLPSAGKGGGASSVAAVRFRAPGQPGEGAPVEVNRCCVEAMDWVLG